MDINNLFPIDPDLKIREELVSIHALNPFVANDSSARSYMFSLHLSQQLVLNKGEPKIIQTGLEREFAHNTFSKKALQDCRVKKIISRYNGIGVDAVDTTTETILLTEDLTTGKLDYIDIPYHFGLHQYFGFKYKLNESVTDNITVGSILEKDTVLADSPAVTDDGSYNFGLNANLLLMSHPATAEDGIIVSESFSKKLTYTIFEERTIEFGSDSFPLNLYGDENNYKAFPEIGEYINDDGVVMVLRDYDPEMSPAMCSVSDAMSFNPMFDKATYCKGPGGKIVDIKAYSNKKHKKSIYTETDNNVGKYVYGCKTFYNELWNAYLDLNNQHKRMYKEDIPVSEKLQRLLVDALAIGSIDNDKITYLYRNEQLDMYRLTFTIEHVINVGIGAKATDMHGMFKDNRYV